MSSKTFVDRCPRLSVVHIGCLRVDLENQTVAGPAGSSGLHRRAEELLLFLCRNPNALVTREQMLQAVWGGRPVEEAAISNCVWQIRKVLGEDAKSVLQTRAKQGYFLLVPDDAWIDDSSLGTRSDYAETAQVAAVDRAMRLLSRSRWVCLGVLLLSVGIALMSGWRPFAPPLLSPDSGMSISVDAPRTMPWLKEIALQEGVEAAFFGKTDIVVFERQPNRFRFAGVHLHVQISVGGLESVRAVITITQSDTTVRERFHGSAAALKTALRHAMRDRLGIAYRKMTPAEHAYVAGKLSELHHDRLGAIVGYRLAIARAPHMLDAQIAMAHLLHFQGRGVEARTVVARLETERRLDTNQRCRLQMLVAQEVPERFHEPGCQQARDRILVDRGDWQALIANADQYESNLGLPRIWLDRQIAMIVAYISIGKFAQADARIAGAVRIARDAGWDYAAVEIGNQKALSLVYQGQLLKAEAMHRSAAEQYGILGDIENADYNTLYAMRAVPGRLGVETMRRRERLGAIIDRARRQGNVDNELEALQLLARIDRGNAAQWDKHIRRMRALGDAALTPDLRVQNTLYVLDEYKFSRRYRAVLDGLRTAGQTDAMDARIWRHLLLIESLFCAR